MYIIELFFKLKEKFNKKTVKPVLDEPLQEQSESDETCEHIFSPIDSTNTVLACVKCGYLIHCNPNDFKKKNIFKENTINTDFENKFKPLWLYIFYKSVLRVFHLY